MQHRYYDSSNSQIDDLSESSLEIAHNHYDPTANEKEIPKNIFSNVRTPPVLHNADVSTVLPDNEKEIDSNKEGRRKHIEESLANDFELVNVLMEKKKRIKC